MKKHIPVILDYIAYLSLLTITGCLIYIVQWLEALRKGWLV